MNLQTALSINAGGPGSGCTGPNCGRPKGDGGVRYTKRQREQLMKKFSTKLGNQPAGLTKQGTIAVEPVPKRLIKQQFLTNKGAQYTLLRTPEGKAELGNKKATGPSYFKGKFRQQTDVKGVEGTRLVSLYQARNPDGSGQSLRVHRDFGRQQVVLHETAHDGQGWRSAVREYKFANFGKAAGFLKQRYGIKQVLPKAGWNK